MAKLEILSLSVLTEKSPMLVSKSKEDWTELTQEVFSEIFKKSAVKRTKFSGLQRNIEALKTKKS